MKRVKHDRSTATDDADRLAAIAMTAASAAASGALRAGARVPPFTLRDTLGRRVSLINLLSRGPVVLHFARGRWCAFGERSLVQLASLHDLIAASGAAVVAIAPPGPSMSTGHALPVVELVDTNMEVARLFGLAFDLPTELRRRYLGLGYEPPRMHEDARFLVPIPGMYLVDQNGIVVLAYIDVDYRHAFDSEALLTALQALRARRSANERSVLRLAAGRRDSRQAI
jgi:peroxiredoxin